VEKEQKTPKKWVFFPYKPAKCRAMFASENGTTLLSVKTKAMIITLIIISIFRKLSASAKTEQQLIPAA
jgi:hypothetical protein